MNTLPTRRQSGFTLIEACIALAISAILLGAALPSLKQARERRHLEGAAAQLRTDIAHARSLAVARNESLRMAFSSPSCYVVHTGASGACRCDAAGIAHCTGGATPLRTVQLGEASQLALSSNSESMLLDAARGTVTPTSTIKLTSRSGAAIHSVVNVMGRVRNCSPGHALPGYPSC
jgi:type IV fimbrial biogenesis protein FimT